MHESLRMEDSVHVILPRMGWERAKLSKGSNNNNLIRWNMAAIQIAKLQLHFLLDMC